MNGLYWFDFLIISSCSCISTFYFEIVAYYYINTIHGATHRETHWKKSMLWFTEHVDTL